MKENYWITEGRSRSMTEKYQEILYHRGKLRRIILAKTVRGNLPGKEYLDSLDVATWSKLDRVLKRLVTTIRYATRSNSGMLGMGCLK